MDRKSADIIVNKFRNTARKRYGSDAYALGFYQSVVLNLLESAKPDVCMAYLAHFEKAARELEQESLISTIDNSG